MIWEKLREGGSKEGAERQEEGRAEECLGFRRNPALLTLYGPKQFPLYSLSPSFLQNLFLLSFASSGYRLSHLSISSIQKLPSSSFRRSS